MLINGKWVKKNIIRSDSKGAYDRVPRSFLDIIDINHPKFQPESGRYHLYVSYACPWATRVLMVRAMKKLQPHIGVDVVHPHMLDHGWHFSQDFPHTTGDSLYHHTYLYQHYQMADPTITTTATVPVLWDKHHKTIVNNESSQIIRILYQAFNQIVDNKTDFYPPDQQDCINRWNKRIYHAVNNGVYRCGFAQSQQAYDEAAGQLFDCLDSIDKHLEHHDYLCGNSLTEADIRLIPTLLRFDTVYAIHFKCSLKRIVDYPHINAYLIRCRKLWPEIDETCFMDHIIEHYYYSHDMLNPMRIVPKLSV